MVIFKLYFFKIQGEFSRRYTVMLHKPLFGIAPETFEAVDINPSFGKMGLVVH